MQEDQDQNPKENLPKPNKEIPSDSIEGKETPTNQTETNKQKENTTEIEKKPYNIIINIPEKKDKAANTANIISGVNVLVAATLAIVTFLLFKQATKDSTTAQGAVKEQIANNRLNRISQRSKDSTDSIARQITFASIKSSDSISKATLQTQINSLRETQKEFEIEHTPYIECKGFKIMNINSGDYPIIIFSIINLTDQTEKIIKGGFVQFMSPFEETKADEKRVKKLVREASLEGKYITKDYPLTLMNNSSSRLNEFYSSQLKNGKYHYYIYGEIIYINEVTLKKRGYKFFIRFDNPVTNNGFAVISNINYNIAK